MRLLVLGGTAFVGRNVVEAALARGHEVSIFNRGRTNPGLFPEAEQLAGDRETDLSPLAGRSFDAVVDTCGYVPRVVRASAELLAPRVERYVFVSSLSVYGDEPVLTESSPTRRAGDPESEDVDREYGPLKALCEQAVEAALPNRAIVVRPGLIVGRYDYTGRFSYWPHRVANGGEVLAPGDPQARIWLIDARDLADWTIRMIEQGIVGTFNASGPPAPLSMGELLDACRSISGSDAAFTWVSDAFLLANDVVPYTEVPLWLPGEDGYPFIDTSRGIASGLTFRPIAETIRDVLERSGGYDRRIVHSTGRARPHAGLDPGRERHLLDLWHRA
jgi:nucleoside-diphosphate-sugar epimerase